MPRRLAPDLRVLDSREEKLDTLLERWNDAQETVWSGQGGDHAAAAGVRMMPLVWNMSYRTLETLLKFMRHLAEQPGESSPRFRARYFHVCAWYLRAERRRAPLMRSDKKGRPYHVTTGDGPQYVIEIKRGGNPRLVLEGLEWISGHFPGEIYLPAEFIERAA